MVRYLRFDYRSELSQEEGVAVTVQTIQLGDDIEWDGMQAGMVTAIDRDDQPGFIMVHTMVGGWLRIGIHETVKVMG